MQFDQYLHLSKLMIEPGAAFVERGVEHSNCLRLRTSHQSTANIAKAITFIVAHSPTYLNEMENLFINEMQWKETK